MKTGLNEVRLMGRLCSDPKPQVTSKNGIPLTTFDLGINTVTFVNKQKIAKKDFIPIVYYGNVAQACNQYLRKGSIIFVKGKIQEFVWVDKQGRRRSIFKVVGTEAPLFLDSQRTSGQELEQANNYEEEYYPSEGVPF